MDLVLLLKLLNLEEKQTKETWTKKNRTFNLRNENGNRRRQANRTNQYQKDSKEMLPVLIKIPQLQDMQDIQGTDEEQQRRIMKRINKNLWDNRQKNLQKENFPIEFQNSQKTG